MQFAAWQARLNAPDESGVPARAHLEAAARRGSPYARAMLTPRPFPMALEYLWEWWQDLRHRVGTDMHGGSAPLSWPALTAWQQMTGAMPAPADLDALFQLDAVSRNPDAVELVPA